MDRVTTQNYTTIKVVVTMKFLTAVSPQKKIYNQSFMRKLRLAVVSLTRGKSAIVDNIPAKLVQAGGETIIDVLTEICYGIWRMAFPVDSVTDYYTP